MTVQLNDIWGEGFHIRPHDARRSIAGAQYRIVSGLLRPGMIAVVIESETYFRDGHGWAWRKARRAKPKALHVVSFGPDPDPADRSGRVWLTYQRPPRKTRPA